MKKLILILALATPLFTAQAHETELHKIMERIGDSFKELVRQARAGEVGPESLPLAESLILEFPVARVEVPLVITRLPEDEKPEALAKYHELMDQIIADLLPLKDALIADDDPTALRLLRKIDRTRRNGHELFKEEDDH